MLGRALRLVRVFHNQTQGEVAKALDLSKSYISEVENEKKAATVDTLEKYSTHFGIPMSSLLLFAERSENPQIPKDARSLVGEKVVRMLEWLEMISGPKEG